MMYCNFTKSQSFPLAFIKVSSQSPRCILPFSALKPQSLASNKSHPKLISCPNAMGFKNFSNGFSEKKKTYENFQLLGVADSTVKFSYTVKTRSFLGGFRNYSVMRERVFSTLRALKDVEGSDNVISGEESLPWLATDKYKAGRRVEKPENVVKSVKSSWEEAAQKFLKSGPSDVEERGVKRSDKRSNYRDGAAAESQERVDPRWDKIVDRVNRFVDVNEKPEEPELRRWNRQESWGKKTWKEAATESSIPKMVGESVYGVGPVLAALSAGRREFYTLYVQEGLDLSGNNRKKKDKKGFEKVLRIAENLGISTKEVSKHDLNMIVGNRPHQGLVIDASPLEMVNIKELDPISADEEISPLWVALDEVTDPQNLGAIIRSSYFFGASGVVLCAKNSAPLSGVVSKASAGSLELTELRSCKNMMQFLLSSAENGWRVLGGSVSSRAVPLNEVTTSEPTILVLGSEGTGLRPLVERSCTQLIRIPGNIPVNVSAGLEDMETGEVEAHTVSAEEFKSFLAVESLNVSVAAGVLLHHLVGTNNCKNGQLQ